MINGSHNGIFFDGGDSIFLDAFVLTLPPHEIYSSN